MKEAVMVSFPPALGLRAPDGGLSEKAARSLRREEGLQTARSQTAGRQIRTQSCGATGEGQSPDLPNDPHLEES